jgi:RecG-like helicase
MNIRELNFLTERERNVLAKNKIQTFEELLYYFPFRYEEAPSAKQIQDLEAGQSVSISGVVVDIEQKSGYHTGTKFTKAVIQHNTNKYRSNNKRFSDLSNRSSAFATKIRNNLEYYKSAKRSSATRNQ